MEGSYTVDFSGLTNPQAAHIHVGQRGVAGPIIFDLAGGASPLSSPLQGQLNAGNFTPRPEQGINTLDDAWRAIREGRAYVNVHTAAYPNGEIRGQLEQGSQPGASPSPGSSPGASPSTGPSAGAP